MRGNTMHPEIRIIYENELESVLQFARAIFDRRIAQTLDPQSREQLLKELDYNDVYWRLKKGTIHIFASFVEGKIAAVIAISPSGNISFFYVDDIYQNQPAELLLFDTIKQKCADDFRVIEMTVESPKVSLPMYESKGFQLSGEAYAQMGSPVVKLRFRMPTQYSAIPEYEPNARKNQYKILIIVVIAVVVGLILLAFLALKIINNLDLEDVFDNDNYGYGDDNGDGYDFRNPFDGFGDDDDYYDYGSDDYEVNGIDTVDEYIADGLSFTADYEEFYLDEDLDEGMTFFYILYPVLEGMADTAIQESINAELEKCAMQSRDFMYPVLPDDMKGTASDDYYWRESMVDYKITYMDENLLSVVFEDSYYLGSIYAEYCDLRTITFDLKTGKIINLSDVINISEDYIKDLRQRLIEESPDTDALYDEVVLSDENIKKILEGERVDGRYTSNFFFKQDGCEVGITYHYRSADDNIIARGYVTAPYSFLEISPFAAQNDLWKIFNVQ